MRARHLIAAAILVVGCGKSKGKSPSNADEAVAQGLDESAVDFAQQHLADLDTKLASADPGSVTGTCAVIKADLPRIEKADPALAATVKQKCGHDRKVREIAVAIDKAEAARKASPDGHLFECTTVKVELGELAKAGFDQDAAVTALAPRWQAACPELAAK